MKRSLSLADYPTFIAEVKDRVRHARIFAARTGFLAQVAAEIAASGSLKQPVPEWSLGLRRVPRGVSENDINKRWCDEQHQTV